MEAAVLLRAVATISTITTLSITAATIALAASRRIKLSFTFAAAAVTVATATVASAAVTISAVAIAATSIAESAALASLARSLAPYALLSCYRRAGLHDTSPRVPYEGAPVDGRHEMG